MEQVLEVKSKQVPEFQDALLNSQGKCLVEAVPNETFWASGLDSQDTLYTKKQFWLGKNKLGEMLQDLRAKLVADADPHKFQTQGHKKKKDKKQPNTVSTRSHTKHAQDAASYMEDSEQEEDTG